MPRNKDALARYGIIHRELKTKFRYKSKRLAEICSEKIGIPISQRTIQKDLNDLKNDTTLGFFLPIVEDKAEKVFYYEKVPESIFPSLELNTDETNALLFYVKTISQYRDYPVFDEITEAIRKVIEGSNIEPSLRNLFEGTILIHTERHPQIEGLEFIPDLLEAIKERMIVQITYQKFEGEKKRVHCVRPLILKEDKHLWYLVGESTERSGMITLALDRFTDLTVLEETFQEIHFDVEEFYKHSFGITVSNDDPIEIEISFTPSQGKYVKTLEIHSTQEIIEDSKKQLLIKVTVKPSYEFFSKILSYGDSARVVSPEHIKDQIIDKLTSSLSNYKSDI